MSGVATPNRTGLFEVQIENGKLAWSKKETDAFPTSEDDLKKIFACIDEALNA